MVTMEDLPPLPPLNDKLHMTMRGPTIASNWVIPGMVMAGAYPGSFDDRENDKNLKTILNKKVDTFVCMQLELDDEIPEEAWRAGDGLRPYFIDARRLSKKPLIWRHLPILDGDCAEDDAMEALVCDLLDDVKAGRVLYIHCLGGHGRAGIVACLMLAVMYGIPVSETFKRVQAYHDTRIEPQGCKSPTTVCQRSQVKRLLEKWKNNRDNPEKENTPAEQVSNAKEPEAPQMIIAKNGARGFIVPPEKNPASVLQLGRLDGSDNQLNRSGAKGPPGVRQQAPTQSKNALFPASSRRQISMHRPDSATRIGNKAAGGGVAAVQMIRKSSAAKLAPML